MSMMSASLHNSSCIGLLLWYRGQCEGFQAQLPSPDPLFLPPIPLICVCLRTAMRQTRRRQWVFYAMCMGILRHENGVFRPFTSW